MSSFRGGVVSKLCRHSGLIEHIFSARMTIQPLSNFSDIEQEEIQELLEDSIILSKDSGGNIWLNPDVEKGFETMVGANENIDLGRLGTYLENIEEEMKHCQENQTEKRIHAIVKGFHNIVFLLEENSKLVTKKRESDYGGSVTHSEKIRYLEYLLRQTKRLSEEADAVLDFTITHKKTLKSFFEEALNKKIAEVRMTISAVRASLIIEIGSMDMLLREARIAEKKDSAVQKKIKMIEYLMDKGRLLGETNILDLKSRVPINIVVDISSHLNGKYADSEEYRERILELSSKYDSTIQRKQSKRSTKKASQRESSGGVTKENFIDVEELYKAFINQDKSLLHFLEELELSDTRDDVVGLYLSIYSRGDNPDMQILREFEDTTDGLHSILKIIPRGEQ